MLSLVVAVMLRAQIESPHVRVVLPNDAIVMVEPFKGAKSLSVQLFVSSRGTAETPKTHGLRHLLEHLTAPGRNQDLDQRIESAGGFLIAKTTRDFIQYDIELPAGEIDLAFRCLRELMQLRDIKESDIAREIKVLEQESAIREVSARLSEAAWNVAYGDTGLDPFGDLAVMRSATPDAIRKLHRASFTGANLLVVVAGDVDAREVTRRGRELLGAVPGLEQSNPARSKPLAGRAESDGLGEARCVPVGRYDDVSTLANLAAAFSIASDVPGSFVTYTPSVRPGLITVGRVGESSGLGLAIDAGDAGTEAARGVLLARRWILNQLQSPLSAASFRGSLASQVRDATPEAMLSALSRVTSAAYAAALEKFKEGKGITVVGR